MALRCLVGHFHPISKSLGWSPSSARDIRILISYTLGGSRYWLKQLGFITSLGRHRQNSYLLPAAKPSPTVAGIWGNIQQKDVCFGAKSVKSVQVFDSIHFSQTFFLKVLHLKMFLCVCVHMCMSMYGYRLACCMCEIQK